MTDSPDKLVREYDELDQELAWAQKGRALAVRILALLNVHDKSLRDVVRDIVHAIKGSTGFEAVGVRLRDGADFPYFETKGFPEHFVLLESSLCAQTPSGEIVRDASGNPVLDCMCGNVIQGRTDPSLPFFTEGGSFWSNCTTQLLATTTEKERQARTRNRCNGEGYESVALVPLRSDRVVIGLLQINDSRKNCFTADMIRFFEEIGAGMGIVLERHRVEQERDRLFNLSMDMLCVMGFDGCFKQVNPAFEETLGWPQDRFLGQSWLDFVHPEEREIAACALALLVTGEPLRQFRTRYSHMDGSYRWVSWNSFPMPAEDLIFCVARDVTISKKAEELLANDAAKLEQAVEERTTALQRMNADLLSQISERDRAEQRLRQSEERYRSLFELSTEAILLVRPDGTLMDINGAGLALLGGTREELIGTNVRQFYANPSDRDEFRKRINGDGALKDYEIHMKTRDGVERYGLLNSTVWQDKDGSTLAYISVVRDVTEARNLEKQLLQSQKMEAIGTLAGGIAHDFNNILTIVLGYAELALADKGPTSENYSELNVIHQTAQRGADLVKQILMFSRKAETSPRPVDLNRSVRDAHRLLDKTIPKIIAMELRLTERPCIINADPVQIEQVLLNLAVNAKDAMPNGGKLIFSTEHVFVDDDYVRAVPELTPGEYVRLSVSDTGQGVPPEVIDRIFEPFFSTKKAGEGTGLGLAMVFGIVKHHGGHIKCYSEAGIGTTFRIYFPIIEEERGLRSTATHPVLSQGTETILIVDDEDLIRSLGERILSRAGYKVLTASNGAEALEIYRAYDDRISLVVLDLMMPEMSGNRCLEELLKVNPAVKAVIASGLTSGNSPSSGTVPGAKGFVSKPYCVDEMLATVRRVLDESN